MDQATIESCVREVAEQYAFSSLSGPHLWQALERDTYARLLPLKRRGTLVFLHVRCNQETSESSPDDAVIAVRYRLPRQVEFVTLRVGVAECG